VGASDIFAIALYGAIILFVGWRAAGTRGESPTPDNWLVADRNLPTWAVLASMVATELSAATFIGVPHAAYTGDWSYLQLAFGALLGKLVLAARVIPLYHRLGVTTVYGFLQDRFGSTTRKSAALCFVAGRSLASGARLFIAALAFSAATGGSIETAIAVSALVAGIYTGRGGLRAVVWTDALQAGVFLGAAAVALWMLDAHLPGGLAAAFDWANEEGRARIFHPDPLFSLGSGSALGSALVAGFFLTLATHSTDHDMVQRLLAARDGRRGGRALWISALINFPMTLLFLAIGTALAYHHLQAPPPYDIGDARQVFPLFALHELPSGLRGLVFAGLFAAAMSSLDSAICAIGATWVSDIAPGPTSAARLRKISAVTCIALAAAALGMSSYQEAMQTRGASLPNLVEFALSAMSVLYGGLLGLFAAGFAREPRADENRDRRGPMGLGLGAAIGLGFFLEPLWTGSTSLAWGYRIPVAAAFSFAVALFGARRRPPA